MIRGIHHVSMKCGTPEEFASALAFYCGLLGMKAVRQWPEGVLIDTGAGLIEIFRTGEGIKRKGAIRHLALSVDDADGYAARIRDAGYTVFLGPKDLVVPSDPPLRARIAFCTGPLGEEIELFSEMNGEERPEEESGGIL